MNWVEPASINKILFILDGEILDINLLTRTFSFACGPAGPAICEAGFGEEDGGEHSSNCMTAMDDRVSPIFQIFHLLLLL